MKNQKIYIALSKETGSLMTGAKGQVAFGDTGTLRKSLGQDWSWRHKASEQGVKVKDLYDIVEIDLADAVCLAGRRFD